MEPHNSAIQCRWRRINMLVIRLHHSRPLDLLHLSKSQLRFRTRPLEPRSYNFERKQSKLHSNEGVNVHGPHSLFRKLQIPHSKIPVWMGIHDSRLPRPVWRSHRILVVSRHVQVKPSQGGQITPNKVPRSPGDYPGRYHIQHPWRRLSQSNKPHRSEKEDRPENVRPAREERKGPEKIDERKDIESRRIARLARETANLKPERI